MNAISRILPLAISGTLLMSGLLAQSADQTREVGDLPQWQIQAAPHATLAQKMNDDAIELRVSRSTDAIDQFLGVILVSFDSKATPYYSDLPPLLANHAVLAAGFASTDFTYMLKRSRLPEGMKVYTQGVVFGWDGVQTTAIEQLGGENRPAGDVDADGNIQG